MRYGIPRMDVLEPPLGDGSGYFVRRRDLSFLQITPTAFNEWRKREVPLGLSAIQHHGLLEDLAAALYRDGLDASDCDIRLKGSSAEFFSGPHKRFPKAKDEVIDLFRDTRSRFPAEWEVAEIFNRLTGAWIRDGDFPTRRPFDSLFQLGIQREPSDLDLQICTDEIISRCEDLLAASGQEITTVRIQHASYNFVRKDLVADACPNLYLFSLRMCDALKRNVSLAVFPSTGPPNTSPEQGDLSAHFRKTDWRLTLTPRKAEAQ